MRDASSGAACSKKCGASSSTIFACRHNLAINSDAARGTTRSCDARRYSSGIFVFSSSFDTSTASTARRRARKAATEMRAIDCLIIERNFVLENLPSSRWLIRRADIDAVGNKSSSGRKAVNAGRGLRAKVQHSTRPLSCAGADAASEIAIGPENDSPRIMYGSLFGRVARAIDSSSA